MKKIFLKIKNSNEFSLIYRVYKQNFGMNNFYLMVLLFSNILTIFFPILFKYFIDNINRISENRDFTFVFVILFYFLAQVLINCLKLMISNNLSNASNIYLRNKFLSKLKNGNSFMIKEKHSQFISVVESDIQVCQGILSSVIFELIVQIISFIVLIVVLFRLDSFYTLLLVLSIPIYLVLFNLLGKRKEKIQNEFLIEKDKLIDATNWLVLNNQVVKIFDVTDIGYVKDYQTAKEAINRNSKKNAEINCVNILLSMIVQVVILVIILITGTNAVSKNLITVGTFSAFILYTFNFFDPLDRIANSFLGIKLSLPSIKRVIQILYLPNEESELKCTTVIEVGDIKISDIAIRNEKKEDMKFEKGKVNQLVGKNGSGKTTLINMLTGYIEVPEKKIYIDGIDITKISKKVLRAQVKVIFQDFQLVSSYVSEIIQIIERNLVNITDYNIENIIEKKLENFQNKSNLISNLSGGEKQLLSFLFTLSFNPKIIFVDESLSNIDILTKKEMVQLMTELAISINIILVSHNEIIEGSKVIVLR
ncbi:ATP-binding cassette domain-containing protein [Carnobacterium maltaromaticum]|uniref:ATP-binding cassette domain-containing protein n=2 Tax=Carnobacterium maltaromaticum TaxID=2751 RepID=UPI0039BE9ECF